MSACATCPYDGIPKDIYHQGYEKRVRIMGQSNADASLAGKEVDSANRQHACQETASLDARAKYGQAILIKCESTEGDYDLCACEFAVKPDSK